MRTWCNEFEPSKLQRDVADLLRLEQYGSDLDEAIVLDAFVAAMSWAAEAAFRPLQAAAFCHLLQRLFVQVEENPSMENVVETLHGHVYYEPFFDMFKEEQVFTGRSKRVNK